MSFNPDEYIASKSQSGGFDPDKYIADKSNNPSFLDKLGSAANAGLGAFNSTVGSALDAATLGGANHLRAGESYLAGKLGIGQDQPYSEKLNQVKQANEQNPILGQLGSAAGSVIPAMASGGDTLLPKAISFLKEAPAMAESTPQVAKNFIGWLGQKGSQGLDFLKHQIPNMSQGAIQNVAQNAGSENDGGFLGGVKNAATGAAESLGLGAGIHAVGGLANKVVSGLANMSGSAAFHSAVPPAAEDKVRQQMGVSIGDWPNAREQIGQMLKEKMITPNNLNPFTSDTSQVFNSLKNIHDTTGQGIGDIISPYRQELVNKQDVVNNVFQDPSLIKSATSGNHEDVNKLQDFISKKLYNLPQEGSDLISPKYSDQMTLGQLQDIQSKAFHDARNGADILTPNGQTLEMARKNMRDQIQSKIGDVAGQGTVDKLRGLNQTYSQVNPLFEQAAKTEQTGSTGMDSLKDLLMKPVGLLTKPVQTAGDVIGNARLSALLKYAPKVGGIEWIAKQMGKSPLEIQSMLQNNVISGQNNQTQGQPQ